MLNLSVECRDGEIILNQREIAAISVALNALRDNVASKIDVFDDDIPAGAMGYIAGLATLGAVFYSLATGDLTQLAGAFEALATDTRTLNAL